MDFSVFCIDSLHLNEPGGWKAKNSPGVLEGKKSGKSLAFDARDAKGHSANAELVAIFEGSAFHPEPVDVGTVGAIEVGYLDRAGRGREAAVDTRHHAGVDDEIRAG